MSLHFGPSIIQGGGVWEWFGGSLVNSFDVFDSFLCLSPRARLSINMGRWTQEYSLRIFIIFIGENKPPEPGKDEVLLESWIKELEQGIKGMSDLAGPTPPVSSR